MIRATLLTATTLVAAAALAAPGAGGGELPLACEIVDRGPSGPAGNVFIVRPGRGGSAILKADDGTLVSHLDPRECREPVVSLRRLDRIVVHLRGGIAYVDERDGLLAPGATPERRDSEVEVLVYGSRSRLRFDATPGRDRILARALSRSVIAVSVGPGGREAAFEPDLTFRGVAPKGLSIRGSDGGDLIDASRVHPKWNRRYFLGLLRLFGGAGPDRILGSPGGEPGIHDGSGDDVVVAAGGNDRLLLGRGEDVLYGGRGDDELLNLSTGTGGPDRLHGGRGSDRLADVDGEADGLRCGRGTDRAVPDEADRVRPDCENVR